MTSEMRDAMDRGIVSVASRRPYVALIARHLTKGSSRYLLAQLGLIHNHIR